MTDSVSSLRPRAPKPTLSTICLDSRTHLVDVGCWSRLPCVKQLRLRCHFQIVSALAPGSFHRPPSLVKLCSRSALPSVSSFGSSSLSCYCSSSRLDLDIVIDSQFSWKTYCCLGSFVSVDRLIDQLLDHTGIWNFQS